MLRPDAASVRAELEDSLIEEMDRLRADVREDIGTAVRATHRSLSEKLQSMQEQAEALRGQVNAARGQLDAMRKEKGYDPAAATMGAGTAPAAQSAPVLDPTRPAGTAMVGGGVVRHTETVQVTTRQTIVDPQAREDRGNAYGAARVYGRGHHAAEQPEVLGSRRAEREERVDPNGRGDRAAKHEESWTEQRLRDRLRDTGTHLFGDPGRFAAPAATGNAYGAAASHGGGLAGGAYAGQHGAASHREAEHDEYGRVRGGARVGEARANGYDRGHYPSDGHERDGYGRDGYERDGRERDGRERDGRERDGYGRDGQERDGRERDGYERDGYGRDGYERDGYGRRGRPAARDGWDRGAVGGVVGDPGWSDELHAGDRWAAMRADEHGREVRMGERRAALHSDGSGTQMRIEDRWAAVRQADAVRSDPYRGDTHRGDAHGSEPQWGDAQRAPHGETRRERREREEHWSAGEAAAPWSGSGPAPTRERHTGTQPALPASAADDYGATWTRDWREEARDWRDEAQPGHREWGDRWQQEELPRPVSARPVSAAPVSARPVSGTPYRLHFEANDDRWR